MGTRARGAPEHGPQKDSPCSRADRAALMRGAGEARHSSGRRAVVVTQQATQPLFAHNLAGVR